MKSFRFLIVFLFISQLCFTQNKYEREVRLDEKEIPIKATQFISGLNFKSKIKWFKEYGLNTISYEAKTKFKGKNYSIEFDSLGILEDVEIIVRKKNLSIATLNKIEKQLQKDQLKYKIGKIQIQYSGGEESVRKKILKNIISEELVIRYEIIVSGKVQKKFQRFEYLFTQSGEFVQRKTIVLTNTDNLEY